MDPEYYIPYIQPSDVSEVHQPIVEMIGIEHFLKLCQYCMGEELYFPVTNTVIRKARNRMILQEYNGYNKKKLSVKYNLTTKQIQKIVEGSNCK